VRGLTARDCLDLCDDGAPLDWVSRGLLLAGAAWPDGSPDACAALPIGVRDRLLIVLRVRTFGPSMAVRFRCPACSADLIATVDLGAVLAEHPTTPPSTVRLEVNGQAIEARLPSSDDLLATTGLAPFEAEWALYDRCLVAAASGDRRALRQHVADAIALADPLTGFEVELECTNCGTRCPETFDIVSAFWKEIEVRADRTAREIDALAEAYGWTEAEVLALSPSRRARYLALRDR